MVEKKPHWTDEVMSISVAAGVFSLLGTLFTLTDIDEWLGFSDDPLLGDAESGEKSSSYGSEAKASASFTIGLYIGSWIRAYLRYRMEPDLYK